MRTVIHIAILKGVDAVALELAVLELADINISRGKGVRALHGHFTVLPKACHEPK